MADTTAHLALPFIMAAQAQKHVTHNEALRMLDGIVQLSVLDRDRLDPPPSPTEGDRYIPATGATGAWSGWDGNVAYWIDGAWLKILPAPGWRAWVEDEGALMVWDGSAWIAVGGGGVPTDPTFNTVGIGGASGDATNRLSVNAPATLFNNAGAGHQLKINKAADGDTASLLFQTNWTGWAEMGLAGDNQFSIKVGSGAAVSALAFTAAGLAGFGTSSPQNTVHAHRASGAVGFRASNNNGFLNIVYSGDGAAVSILSSSPNGTQAFADFSPMPSDGSSAASLRCLRNSATTGLTFFGVHKGDGSATFNSRLSGVGASFINADSGNLGVGLTNPADKLSVAGVVAPSVDNSFSLGRSGARWSSVWAANGTIQTSDARDKVIIDQDLSWAPDFVSLVDPALFRWNVGGLSLLCEPAYPDQPPHNADAIAAALAEDDPWDVQPEYLHEEAGGRQHAGFLAQDVRGAMDAAGVDFGAWGLEDKDDPDSKQFLRPDQLIPVLWKAVQVLQREVAELRAGGGKA